MTTYALNWESVLRVQWMQRLTRSRSAHFSFLLSIEAVDARVSGGSPMEYSSTFRKNGF
jgi:hypothetical protein